MPEPGKQAVSPALRCEVAGAPAGPSKSICVKIHEVYSNRRIVPFWRGFQGGGVNPQVESSVAYAYEQ